MRAIRLDHGQQLRQFITIGKGDRLTANAGRNNRPLIFGFAAAGGFIPNGRTTARFTISQQPSVIETIQHGGFWEMAVVLDAIETKRMHSVHFPLHSRTVREQAVWRPIAPRNGGTYKNTAAIQYQAGIGADAFRIEPAETKIRHALRVRNGFDASACLI